MSLCTHTVVMVEVSANITTETYVVCSGQTRSCNINEQLDITYCLSSYVSLSVGYIYIVYICQCSALCYYIYIVYICQCSALCYYIYIYIVYICQCSALCRKSLSCKLYAQVSLWTLLFQLCVERAGTLLQVHLNVYLVTMVLIQTVKVKHSV